MPDQPTHPDRRIIRSVSRLTACFLLHTAYWAGCAACLATLLGSLGTHWWFLDLLSHFQVHYAVILLLCTCGLLLAKPRRRCTIPLVGLLFTLNLLWGAAQPVPQIGPIESPIRLLSINVYAGNPRIERIEDYVQRIDPDLLVLMEITSDWQPTLERLAHRYPHHVIRTHPAPFGIALFSRLPVDSSTILELGGSGVPSIQARLRHEGQPIELLAIHTLPPISASFSETRNRQLEALSDHARQCRDPLIVVGDLNLTPWSPWFRRLLERTHLLDTRNGFGIQPSWPARFRWLGIPIDHCLVSPQYIIRSRSCGPNLGSDHLPVLCDFGLKAVQ